MGTTNKTLQLNLKRQWFDMIHQEIKKAEYREIKPYWCSRFLTIEGRRKSVGWWKLKLEQCGSKDLFICWIEKNISIGAIKYIEYPEITFSNGMTPPVPRFNVERKETKIATGKEEWGAEKGVKYFVIELGNITKSNVK